MKLTAILMLAFALHVNAKSWSQTVTFTGKSVSLEKVFAAIEKQTGYVVFYDYRQIAGAKPVSIDVKNEPLVSFLNLCFQNQPFGYTFEDKTIMIAAKGKKDDPKTSTLESHATLPITGKVLDSTGAPLPGATVAIKNGKGTTSTNANGEFNLNVAEGDVLLVSYVGYETRSVIVTQSMLSSTNNLVITLRPSITKLEDVQVTVNTGYQQIPKERSNGSFAFVDSTLINRRVSTNILDRLEGIVPGLLFTKNKGVTTLNQSDLSIRGRSTIFANPNPLVVLDNFPYDGDLSTINPNDIENITILRDAAAASIWGAQSGNGVIVITTKKGKYNQPLKLTFNSNFTFGEKPDLFYQPFMNSSDYIEVEKFLFDKGFYNSTLSSSNYPAITSVIEILARKKAGLISAADSATQINNLENIDNRYDLKKYVFQKSFNQQYSINLIGGGSSNQYFFSFGYDKNQPNLTYNDFSRFTLNSGNTYSLLNNKLELGIALRFTQTESKDNNNGSLNATNIPYNQIADKDGNPIAIPNVYRQRYVDTAGQGRLLDWRYYPLNEIRYADNTTKNIDYNLKANAKYRIVKDLDVNLIYQFSNGKLVNENNQSQYLFYVRDMINKFSQVNFTTGNVTRPVPLGGILDTRTSDYYSHQVRGQINYVKSWNRKHELNALVGSELKDLNTFATTNRYFGYNDNTKTYSTQIDFANVYPTFTGGTSRILSSSNKKGTTQHYLSYFANGGYAYLGKYSFTGSIRRDEANILGATTNEKGVPLWSVGLGWSMSKEKFYHLDWLPYLKFKTSYGYNGNLDKQATAVLTQAFFSPNQFGSPYSIVAYPPNSELRWERIRNINLATEFASKNRIITGSIEYYFKRGTDLLGNGLIAPQSGLSQFYGNIADINGHGFDVNINSKNISRKDFQWFTTLNISHAIDKITNYKIKKSNISGYTLSSSLSPLEGFPLYSIFSYKWAGLDSLGNPLIMYNGKASNNYTGLIGSTDFTNLKYNGPATPTYFGNF